MRLYLAISSFTTIAALLIADVNGEVFIRAFRRSVSIEDKSRIKVRLEELGKNSIQDYENFRIYQMILIATSAAILFSLVCFQILSISAGFVALCFIIPAIIFMSERRLTKSVIHRREIIESEFPALIELFTLAIGAGESPSGAVKRIAARASGILPEEFSFVTSEIERGKSFTFALDSLSRRASSPVVRRFADSMAVAISRGTPLVETLTHSVREARSTERIKVLSIAAKAEISMMIPVVFLILPISILFAMYPSMASLDLFT